MTYLPSRESTDLAPKADLDTLENRLVGKLDVKNQGLETMGQRLETVSQRIDRMVLALIATLVAQSLI